jgi:hypothetical protein
MDTIPHSYAAAERSGRTLTLWHCWKWAYFGKVKADAKARSMRSPRDSYMRVERSVDPFWRGRLRV